MAASASLNWQKPASWFNSTPRFLAAQRSAVSSRREEVAQRKPLKGFPLDSFGNKRAAALLRSREFQICSAFPMGQFSTDFGSTLFLACKYLLVCKMTNNLFAEQQIWWYSSAARHFCSAKILAGELRWGWGPRRSRQWHRPRKEISRGNLLCAESGLPDLSYPRLAITQKYVTTLDKRILNTGQPQGARGTAVPLFREESRGTPSKGFLWATSS